MCVGSVQTVISFLWQLSDNLLVYFKNRINQFIGMQFWCICVRQIHLALHNRDALLNLIRNQLTILERYWQIKFYSIPNGSICVSIFLYFFFCKNTISFFFCLWSPVSHLTGSTTVLIAKLLVGHRSTLI